MKRGLPRRLAAALIVFAGTLLVCGIFSIGLTNKSATERDYIEYWAAGHLLVEHANSYSLPAILRVEQTAGLESQDPKASVSPPVAVILLVPLGFVSAKTGLILWLLAQIACLSVSILIFWIIIGKPGTRLHLLGYIFAPALACLQAGQLGIFMLFGVMLFLLFCDTKPFPAGFALMPCALKPHLFLPFVAALLLWSVYRKNLGIITGFLSSMIATCGLTLLFDRRIWVEYIEFMRSTRLMQIQLPTLSAQLRFLVAPQAAWLQYLPTIIATCWAVWFFWSRRDQWDWMSHGLLILLVSLMCAPYAWLTDEAILLPAVLIGIYRALEARRSWIPIAVIAASTLIELFAGLSITAWYYTWTTPAWLGWYLYATGKLKGPQKSEENPVVQWG
jgi:hypothetical protein